MNTDELRESAGRYGYTNGMLNCGCTEKKCGHWIADELDAEEFFEAKRLKAKDEWLNTDAWKALFDSIEEAKQFAQDADQDFFSSALVFATAKSHMKLYINELE